MRSFFKQESQDFLKSKKKKKKKEVKLSYLVKINQEDNFIVNEDKVN